MKKKGISLKWIYYSNARKDQKKKKEKKDLLKVLLICAKEMTFLAKSLKELSFGIQPQDILKKIILFNTKCCYAAFEKSLCRVTSCSIKKRSCAPCYICTNGTNMLDELECYSSTYCSMLSVLRFPVLYNFMLIKAEQKLFKIIIIVSYSLLQKKRQWVKTKYGKFCLNMKKNSY